MQVQSIFSGKGDKVQTVGLAAFIGAAILFALGFILMLAADGAFMSRQLPLILMTVAAIDICFAAALSSVDLPSVEKTRLRALSIMGAIVVVIAATLIASNFRAGAFEIVIMLVALGGAPGMFKLGEIAGVKLKTSAAPAAKKQAAPKAEEGESTPAA
jgi:4-amino-4-deoxy-L-arabinose transferase-like glycosyltransferase